MKQSKALVLGLSWWVRKEGRWVEPSCSKGQKVNQRLANLQCTERVNANQKLPAVIRSLDLWILEETLHPRGPEGMWETVSGFSLVSADQGKKRSLCLM